MQLISLTIFLIQINDLSESIHRKKTFPNYQPSPEYSSKLFGVEYLYSQSGISFCPKDDDLESQIDEGFADIDEVLDMPTDTDDITACSCGQFSGARGYPWSGTSSGCTCLLRSTNNILDTTT